MYRLLKNALLPATVFITGACVLVIEVVAVRVLSPYFGNTIFSYSSVISVILMALSIGYYLGGRFADKHLTKRWLFSIILVSGLLVLAFHVLGQLILEHFSESFSLATGPLVFSTILFLIPSLLLGTISPYAIALKAKDSPDQGIGNVAGVMFFFSTFGSIFGSLLAGFVLIPNAGIDKIFISTSLILVLLGVVPLVFISGSKRFITSMVILGLVLAITSSAIPKFRPTSAVYATDGIYSHIQVSDTIYKGHPTRILLLDQHFSSGKYLYNDDPSELVFEYTRYWTLYKVFTPRVERVLVLGAGAWSIPNAYIANIENAQVDVVDIEPELFNIAKKYFAAREHPRLHNFVEDGRKFLRTTDKTYDVIYSDVFQSVFAMPAHFGTREYYEITREKLSRNGIYIANVIGDLRKGGTSIIYSQIRTMKEVFPQVFAFAVEDPNSEELQNVILVGYKSEKAIDLTSEKIRNSEDKVVRDLKNHMVDIDNIDLEKYPTMTDDFAPMEYYSGEQLKRNGL